MSATPEHPSEPEDMRRSYVRVLLVWIATLAGLLALQEYFS